MSFKFIDENNIKFSKSLLKRRGKNPLESALEAREKLSYTFKSPVLSMRILNKELIVCCQDGVYKFSGNKFKKIKFKNKQLLLN